MLNKIDVASYTGDTTPYVSGDGTKQAIDLLKNASDELFCWFASNYMKTNPDKCHLITSCDKETSVCLNNYNIANGK